MRLQEAAEVLAQLQASAEGEAREALALAVEALNERAAAVRAEADRFCEMLDHVFAAEGGDRQAAWGRVRHLFRLVPEVLAEVEERLADQG